MSAYTRMQDEQLDEPCAHGPRGSECGACGWVGGGEMMDTNRPELMCKGCGKQPSEIDEYVMAGRDEGMTPDNYCWEEEGTLNHESGQFLCTKCYVFAGTPSTPRGWTA